MKTSAPVVRALRAIFAPAAILVSVLLAFFYAHAMDNTQVGLVTLLVSALIGDLKTSAAYFFEGVPEDAKDHAPADPAPQPSLPKEL